MTQAIDRDHVELARQVRARRLELGLSLAALAERAGVSKGTYHRIEEGQPIRDTNYVKIDTALGWVPGSCAAIREGGTAALANEGDGPPTSESSITEDDIGDAVMIVAVRNSELSASEIRTMRDGVIQELKQRGLL